MKQFWRQKLGYLSIEGMILFLLCNYSRFICLLAFLCSFFFFFCFSWARIRLLNGFIITKQTFHLSCALNIVIRSDAKKKLSKWTQLSIRTRLRSFLNIILISHVFSCPFILQSLLSFLHFGFSFSYELIKSIVSCSCSPTYLSSYWHIGILFSLSSLL